MNRAQRRKNGDTKAKQLDANKETAKAAQTLLDGAAVIVQATKKGVAPTHLEVIGLATIILNDVYDELMKQMTAGSEDAHKPEVTTDEEQAQPAESEK